MASHVTRLLVDEPSRSFSPSLAKRIGLQEAIVVQQIHFWVGINQQKGRNQHGEFFWTWNTVEEWLKEFPWLSRRTLERVLHRLEKDLCVVVSRRTTRFKWYRLDHPVLVVLCGK